MKFTPEQCQAIQSDKNLLVSASAGTGKTTVMIERIVNLVLQKKAALDRMVVVTFTTAAATQIKDRLRARLAEEAGDPHIRAELEKIDLASISTLHSFCSEILREYFYVADVDPAYSILDPQAAANIIDKALDNVFAEYYKNGDEAFGRLTRIFHKKRSDKDVKKIILELYSFAVCQPDFAGWYENARQNYLSLGVGSPFEKTLNDELTSAAASYSECFDAMSAQAKNYGAARLSEYLAQTAANYRINKENPLKTNLEFLSSRKSPGNLAGKLILFEGLDAEPEEFESFIEEIRETRKKAEDWAKKYKTLMSRYGYDVLVENSQKTLPLLDKLAEIVDKFRNQYSLIKKEKGVLDFSDLEHLCLKVLSDEQALSELRSRYKLVFVDEYQDINTVQEAIISALAVGANAFYVGDVKQSIYGFRETNPDIFIDKLSKFADKNDCAVINLNQNFRSDKRILDFVNEIFSRIMTAGSGRLDYAKTSLLRGEVKCLSGIPAVSIDVIKLAKTEREVSGAYDILKPEETVTPQKQIAELVAEKILGLLGKEITMEGATRAVGYGDIAILMRDMKEGSKAVYDKLKSLDIPVAAVFGEARAKECADPVNFLRSIDNLKNDIYVAGTALSHFGGFTHDELSKIKLCSLKEVFIDNLKAYVEKNNDVPAKKASVLLSLFERYRMYSKSLTVDALLQKLVTDDGIYGGQNYLLYLRGLANGQIRCNRLTQMLSSIKGKAYSSSVDKYLEYLDEGKAVAAASPDVGDAVTLTTIHKSKGLEYPVVIAPNIQKKFRYTVRSVSADRDLGLAMRHYDFADKTISPSLAALAVETSLRRREKEEELRLFYVLLTRAKYSLSLIAAAEDSKKTVSPREAASPLDWLSFAFGGVPLKEFSALSAQKPEPGGLVAEQSADKRFVERSIAYKYPYAGDIQTPLKVSASRIKRFQEDEDYGEYEKGVSLVGADDDAALIGSAYHKLYEGLRPGSTLEEIKQNLVGLTEKGEISIGTAEKIDCAEVHAALENKEFAALLNGEIYHEIPFMLKANYAELTGSPGGETVLQGVIDMLVVRKNSATVIDFKYTSRPENIVKNYTPQLKAYALAANKILGLDADAYILSIKDNKLIKII